MNEENYSDSGTSELSDYNDTIVEDEDGEDGKNNCLEQNQL